MKLKEYTKEYGKSVVIGQQNYLFYNDIGKMKDLLASFNRLVNHTFHLSFDGVGGFYEPHVLVYQGEVCANVSVNQVPFVFDGKSVFFIQIGTVVTKKQFRNRGLSRWLMTYILQQWKGKCDAIYLFANDQVLDFYPRFGFQKQSEFHCYTYMRPTGHPAAKRLQMDQKQHVQLALQKFAQGNPFSRLCMTENNLLFTFYCLGAFKDGIYYSSKFDVLLLAELVEGKWWCYDIFGETDADMEQVVRELPFEQEREIVFGFTPKNTHKLFLKEHKERDTTLFICSIDQPVFQWQEMMFPLISHA